MSPYKITIPEPCHEDWNTMTRTDQGRFCQTCSKEVIDFTSVTNNKILNHLSQNKNTCGRLSSQQLNTPILIPKTKSLKWSLLPYVSSLLFALGMTNPLVAQEKPKIEITTKQYISIPLQQTQQQKITVNGTIIEEENTPLPGASIVIKGTTIGTNTDFDGNFNIECNSNDTLIINYIGFHPLEIKANEMTQQNITMKLNPDIEIMFTGAIAGPTKHWKSPSKRWLVGKIWIHFTNLFRKEKKDPKYRL